MYLNIFIYTYVYLNLHRAPDFCSYENLDISLGHLHTGEMSTDILSLYFLFRPYKS